MQPSSACPAICHLWYYGCGFSHSLTPLLVFINDNLSPAPKLSTAVRWSIWWHYSIQSAPFVPQRVDSENVRHTFLIESSVLTKSLFVNNLLVVKALPPNTRPSSTCLTSDHPPTNGGATLIAYQNSLVLPPLSPPILCGMISLMAMVMMKEQNARLTY